MAHVPFMLAGGPMQVYRARNPKKSPLWQCASRHYDEFEENFEVFPPKTGWRLQAGDCRLAAYARSHKITCL